MRIAALVAAVALASWSGPALAQATDDAGSAGGLEINGPDTAPGNDYCRTSSAPFDCAVARSKINEALSNGAEISITIKRRPPEATGP
jgi:hypothetical protein